MSGCHVVVGEGVLVGAVGGTTVGERVGDVAWVVGLGGAVVGTPVGLGPRGAVVVVDSRLGVGVTFSDEGARVVGACVPESPFGGAVAAGAGRTPR